MDSEQQQTPASAVNWTQVFTQSFFTKKIEFYASEIFKKNTVDAEMAVTNVLLDISRDNWHKIRNHQFKAPLKNPTAFLLQIFRNSLIEEFRKKYGRPRPPAWIKKQGQVWTDIWKQLCLEKKSPEEILYLQLGSDRDDPTQKAYILSIIKSIKAKEPVVSPIPSSLPFDVLTDTISDEIPLSEADEETRYETALILMHCILNNTDALHDVFFQNANKNTKEARALIEKLKALKKSINLTDREILLLKSRYKTGKSEARHHLEKALSLSSYELQKAEESTLTRIRECFLESTGITWDECCDLLRKWGAQKNKVVHIMGGPDEDKRKLQEYEVQEC